LRRGRFPRQLRRELVDAGTLPAAEKLLLDAAPDAGKLVAEIENAISNTTETDAALPIARPRD
jgi:hypothetical protein